MYNKNLIMKEKYSEENLRKVVSESLSIADVCRAVGIKPIGGNYKTINNKLKQYNIY